MSYEFKISAKDRFAGRFIGAVRKALLRAAMTEKKNSGISQQSIANKLGVNRSVINRILKGQSNLTLRSIAEIAWALGWEVEFSMRKVTDRAISQTTRAGRNDTPVVQPLHALTEEEISRLLGDSRIIARESRTSNDNYAPIEVAA